MSKRSDVESVFFGALGKATPEERAAFLELACAGDDELRRQVEQFLECHPKLGDFLLVPGAELSTEAASSPEGTKEPSRATDGQDGGKSPHQGPALSETESRTDGAIAAFDLALRRLPERIGRYRIERVLGQGGFGVVYLCSGRAVEPPGGRQGAKPRTNR